MAIITPDDRRRCVTAPWRGDGRFSLALHLFHVMAHQPIQDREEWEEIHDYALTVGRALYRMLFDEASAKLLQHAFHSGHTPPALNLLSTDDPVLALPWELLHDGTSFLVSEGRLDLMRSTIDASFSQFLGPPTQHFKLLVNVSAPRGLELNYEEESYRISKVLSDLCDMITCELGTLDDLVMTAARFAPLGIHFSGHGSPGTLVFETDENEGDRVPIDRVVQRLRTETPSGLPQFFFLASCHGNTPTRISEGHDAGASAAKLHREGVTEVIGYFGPIVEHLSTLAEETLYSAISAGRTTRFAVRQARLTLAVASSSTVEKLAATSAYPGELAYPFAWSQLVFYRRGCEYPLSLPVTPSSYQQAEGSLQRTFQDAGNRRILISGFIGRRTELHSIRRKLRSGQRVFVFQGLGGLGKTTLAVHLLSWLGKPEEVCVVWCQDLSSEVDPAIALVGRLIDYGHLRFGADFDDLLAPLDQKFGGDSARRCRAVLDLLVARVPNLIVYFDNMETLLIGPDKDDHAKEFAEWRSADLLGVWRMLLAFAENTAQLRLLASTRYINSSFPTKYQFPLAPLGRDAIFRLTKWFPALRRLSWRTRAHLAERLAGHPRAVELTNTLVDHALAQWELVRGPWRTPDSSDEKAIANEWEKLVRPALPDVQGRLESNLLLDAIWDRVLTDRAHRMLYRMSLMRGEGRISWNFVEFLGDTEIPTPADEATASLLLRSSLLVVFDEHLPWMPNGVRQRLYGLHPSTLEYVRRRFGDDAKLRQETHYRVGCALTERRPEEDELKKVPAYELYLESEASYHFLESENYSLAATASCKAAKHLLHLGRARQVLQMLQPFQEPHILSELAPHELAYL
ncbi:MAG: CHAT domain-containing protein, partial [Deltaproteobacteria bacterium]|nr:CHAT domain-containing protein [Deltaproteobacteria bacterium]